MKITTTKLAQLIQKGQALLIKNSINETVISPNQYSLYSETMAEYFEGTGTIGPFLIISAPGATGKSAFCNFLGLTVNGNIWNMANATLGDNYLLGTLATGYGPALLANTLDSINKNDFVLILDALDEVEISSGWKNIEKLIDDIYNTFPKTKNRVVVISRTETATYIKYYLDEKYGVNSYSYATIQCFSDNQIINFCRLCYKQYKKVDMNVRLAEIMQSVINTVKESYENASKMTNMEDVNRFIGYAPVLQAITRYVSDYNNPQELSKLYDTGEGYIDIIIKIMDQLLEREKNKFIDQFKKASAKIEHGFSNWNNLYSYEEQIERILSYCNHEKIQTNYLEYIGLPDSLYQKYEEAIASFLPQHPFVLDNIFAGPAFSEYCIINHMKKLSGIEKYNLLKRSSKTYTPLLWEIYSHSYEIINTNIVGFLIDSIISGQKEEQEISFLIQGNKYTSVDLSIIIDNITKNETHVSQKFKIATSTDSLKLNTQINRVICKTDSDIKIGLGDVVNFAESYIECNNLEIDASTININQYSINERTIIYSKSCHIYKGTSIKINHDFRGSLLVDWPGAESYPWSQYYCKRDDSIDIKDFKAWYLALRSILSWFRKDKRSNFGKHKEMIENIAIGSNVIKNSILNFLKSKSIIKEYAGDCNYYLNTQLLEEKGINYSDLLNAVENANVENMYREYLAFYTK